MVEKEGTSNCSSGEPHCGCAESAKLMTEPGGIEKLQAETTSMSNSEQLDAGSSSRAGTAEAAHALPLSEEAIKKAILSLDNLGIAASTLCLIHCMAMPFVIAFLPFLGLQFLEGHQSHVWLAGLIWTFALFAIVPGYLKHKKAGILIGMGVGLTFVSLAVFGASNFIGERGELYSITIGNLILVAVHWKNRGLCKCCGHHP